MKISTKTEKKFMSDSYLRHHTERQKESILNTYRKKHTKIYELIGDKTQVTRKVNSFLTENKINSELECIKQELCKRVSSLKEIQEIDFTKKYQNNNVKTTRSISSILNPILFYSDMTINGIQLRNLTSTIGEFLKGAPDSYRICLSIKMEDILRLGNYGPDAGSCFHKEGDRIELAKIKNSFVIYLTKDDLVIGRCFGLLKSTVHNRNVYLTNSYTKNNLSQYFFMFIASHFVKRLFKLKNHKLKTSIMRHNCDRTNRLYINYNNVQSVVGTNPVNKLNRSIIL